MYAKVASRYNSVLVDMSNDILQIRWENLSNLQEVKTQVADRPDKSSVANKITLKHNDNALRNGLFCSCIH